MTVKIGTVTLLFVVLWYSLIFLWFWWRFRPFFPRYAVRLSVLMWVAQALLIAISLKYPKQAGYERWLWNLHEEWNIPATFASIQLAWVGGCALVIAYLAKKHHRAHRIYWLAFGLIFLFLGLDEFIALHESLPGWERFYAFMGATGILLTVFVATQATKQERIWYIGILVGLAVGVSGALILNSIPTNCEGILFIRFRGCLQFYVWEEVLEFLGIWLVLVSVLGVLAGVAAPISPRIRNFVCSVPAIWSLLLIGNSFSPRWEVEILAKPADVTYSEGVSLLGSVVNGINDGASGKITAYLYTTARQVVYRDKGFSIRMIDQADQTPLAWKDEWNDRQHGLWLLGPNYSPVYRQRVVLRLPPDIPSNRAFWLTLALWTREGKEFPNLTILASDQRQLSDTQVVLREFVIPAEVTVALPETALDFRFSNGYALRGAGIPDSARSGDTLEIPMTWEAATEGDEDWQQFLHFVHEESGALWNHDQQPLGARLPTRLWYEGLRDTEAWQITLPEDLAPGRYALYTGLYRLSDGERLPVTDVDGVPLSDARVPLGYLTIAE